MKKLLVAHIALFSLITMNAQHAKFGVTSRDLYRFAEV